MPAVEFVERISLLEVIRQTARGYARQPRLMFSASAITVLAICVLHLHLLTRSPVTGVLAAVINLAVLVGFITFVLVAVEMPTDRQRGIAGAAQIARRANASGIEVGLLLLVMGITVAVLSGLLEFAFHLRLYGPTEPRDEIAHEPAVRPAADSHRHGRPGACVANGVVGGTTGRCL